MFKPVAAKTTQAQRLAAGLSAFRKWPGGVEYQP